MNKKIRALRSQSVSRKNQTLTDQAIALYPHLKPYIQEWPELINSLVDTRHVNYLVGDGAAYLSTGLQFTPDNADTFRFELDAIHPFTPYVWNIHGCGDRPACCVGFSPQRQLAYGNGNVVFESRPASTLIGEPVRFQLDMQQGTYTVSPAPRHPTFAAYAPFVQEHFTIVRPSRAATMQLFRWNPNGTPFVASIAQAKIHADGTEHTLVPYRRSTGECGLLDLTDLTFHDNIATRGKFSIVTV